MNDDCNSRRATVRAPTIARGLPKWSKWIVVLTISMICLLAIKSCFLDEVPRMRFIVPTGFRGGIRLTRSSTGIVPPVSGSTMTFVISDSGKVEIHGELPYERSSLTEAFWSHGQEIRNGFQHEDESLDADEIYFWASHSDRSNLWCFVGTQTEYHSWLEHGSESTGRIVDREL